MSDALDRERLAVLVHEVRSPVAALGAIAQAVSDPADDQSVRRELVRLAIAACAAIERIVLDLAVASVRLVDLDARALAEDVATGYVLRGADIVSELGQGELVVRADPVRLRQALDNLVANAVAHGGRSHPVRVSAERTADRVVIAVADRGPGIPSEELQRIFEPGVRLDRSSPGSGLGLPLVKAIVERHGGTVAVTSTEGAGTTFLISLPVPSAQPAT